MALKQIKERLQSLIQDADENAVVFTQMRNITTDAAKKQLVGRDGLLHCWQIRRELTALLDLVINQNVTQQLDTLVMELFLSVSEEKESTALFDAAVDAVLQAVNADRRSGPGGTKLSGLVAVASTPAVRKFDFVEYAGALCHHAEIAMTVTPAYLQ